MRIFHPYRDELSKAHNIALRLRHLCLDIDLAHLPMSPGAYTLGLSFQSEPSVGAYLSICFSLPFIGSFFLTIQSIDILTDPEARRIYEAASSPGVPVRECLTPYQGVSRWKDRFFRSRGVCKIHARVTDRGTWGDSDLGSYKPALWEVIPESVYMNALDNRDICDVITVSFEEFHRLDI